MAITEYRGVEGLVYAEVTQDDLEAYVTGEVKPLAPVAEISKTTESSSETHYYDNSPAVIITTAGADEITCTVSAIPLEVLADITGQTYDKALGAFMEGQRVNKYFALGYETKKTDGTKVYVWRLKGTFGIPDSTHITENDGTDANGQEIVFTGIETTHKFSSIGKGAKAINVDVSLGLANVSAFFETVTTPDTLSKNLVFDFNSDTENGVNLTSVGTIGNSFITIETGGSLPLNESITFSPSESFSIEVIAECEAANSGVVLSGNSGEQCIFRVPHASYKWMKFQDKSGGLRVSCACVPPISGKHHYVMVYDADTKTFVGYMDGVKYAGEYDTDNTKTYDSFAEFTMSNLFGTHLGYSSSGKWYYFRVVKGVLTPAQFHKE